MFIDFCEWKIGRREYSRVSNNRTYVIKRSHPINMLSIQIDTKSLELVINHQFNNIKLSFFASHMKSSFPDAVRLLDTLEYLVDCCSWC